MNFGIYKFDGKVEKVTAPLQPVEEETEPAYVEEGSPEGESMQDLEDKWRGKKEKATA